MHEMFCTNDRAHEAYGWFPSNSWTDRAEVRLPADNGRLLSTGTLDDISQERGPVTSLRVASGAHSQFYGNTQLGLAGLDTTLSVFSTIKGAQALQFGRHANLDENGSVAPMTRLHASAVSSGENLIMLPNVGGTVLMQNAKHVSLYEDQGTGGLHVGEAAVIGALHIKGDFVVEPKGNKPDPQEQTAVKSFAQRNHSGHPQVTSATNQRCTLLLPTPISISSANTRNILR